MIKIHNKLKYVGSFLNVNKMPVSDKEVCFIGRSNVGKSTMINAIANENLSFTSKQSGKTVCINFFQILNTYKYLIDMPGYGFAKSNKEIRDKWNDSVVEFFQTRVDKCKTYLILDTNVPVLQSDIDVVRFLLKTGVEFAIIFNKIDKLKPAKQVFLPEIVDAKMQEFKTALDLTDELNSVSCFKTSSKKKDIKSLCNDVLGYLS